MYISSFVKRTIAASINLFISHSIPSSYILILPPLLSLSSFPFLHSFMLSMTVCEGKRGSLHLLCSLPTDHHRIHRSWCPWSHRCSCCCCVAYWLCSLLVGCMDFVSCDLVSCFLVMLNNDLDITTIIGIVEWECESGERRKYEQCTWWQHISKFY